MNFFNKPTVKDQLRQNERDLRRNNREMDRDQRKLELEEKKLEAEIKKSAKLGNKEACTVLAKQLVQIRKQKSRHVAASGKIQAVASQQKTMGASARLTSSMASTTRTMEQMNRLISPQQVAGIAQDFSRQTAQLDMADEMMNDTLDDLLTESGDEEESQAVMDRVLDEIGIEVSGKVRSAPDADRGAVGISSGTSSQLSDRDIETSLAQLRS